MAQSQDISQAGGNPIEIEIDGKTWKLSPLTVGDLAALQENIRNRRLAAVQSSLAGLDKEALVDIVCDITKSAIDGETMDREMETLAGCQFSIWRSLHRNHKELTLEMVGEMFTMDSLFNTMLPVLKQLSGLEDEGNPTPAPHQATPSPGISASPFSSDTTDIENGTS